MSRKKVLYITPFFPNRGDSAAGVRANQLLHYLDRTTDLRILGYGDPRDPADTVLMEKTVLADTKNAGLSYMASLFLSPYPRAFYRHNTETARRHLEYLMNEFKPDIVHLDTLKVLCHISRIREAKVVMHTHDAHTKKIATRYSWRRGVFFNIDIFLQFLKIRNVEKNLSKQAAVCIVDSETDRRAILSLNPQLDTRVVPIGFDPQIYCPDGRKAELSGKSVIFTGNMGSDQTEFAAIELIEKIMPRIWGEHPDARLYLVGANPSKRLFSYDDRIIVTGFVDNVAEYLRGATVYVCPLRIGSGMKTRIIEALAAGSALISTRSGLEGLMPGEDSDRPWVHAESTIELAAAANDLLAAPQTVKDLSCRAAAYALRQNSWQAVAERIERIYEDISS